MSTQSPPSTQSPDWHELVVLQPCSALCGHSFPVNKLLKSWRWNAKLRCSCWAGSPMWDLCRQRLL